MCICIIDLLANKMNVPNTSLELCTHIYTVILDTIIPIEFDNRSVFTHFLSENHIVVVHKSNAFNRGICSVVARKVMLKQMKLLKRRYCIFRQKLIILPFKRNGCLFRCKYNCINKTNCKRTTDIIRTARKVANKVRQKWPKLFRCTQ